MEFKERGTVRSFEASLGQGKYVGEVEFDKTYFYDGDDLGVVYTKHMTTFRVWAPTAFGVTVKLYERGEGNCLLEIIRMARDVKGTYVAKVGKDLHGVYYTYAVVVNGIEREAVDPYAVATGVNGRRGMVLDLDQTNPEGFDKDKKPEFLQKTDAIIYELHIRDLSADASSRIKHVGKFLALTEKGTTNDYGQATGLDHLIHLGITHLHLMPCFDFESIDEANKTLNHYNWGYDPQNYNVLEGSYSTDPFHGEVRVREFKEMVYCLHRHGIRVIMDVVYNHTFSTDSNLNRIVPDYYYRKAGYSYSNGSGCGNETASERAMVRKYIVDSVCFYAKEYHIDGFRFDLMGLHDIDTMNTIREALDQIDPSILLYGEGWVGGASVLPDERRAVKMATSKLNGVAAFSDDIRDGLKGKVFDARDIGFVSGKQGMEETIKFCVVGATNHTSIDYSKTSARRYWAKSADQCINYVSCHDNLTLWDKLVTSRPDATWEELLSMYRLASSIVFTSQGIPFLQAGEEMVRSKPSATRQGVFDDNSYASGDYTNSLKWNNLEKYKDMHAYYQGLIAFRRMHPGLRYISSEDINKNLSFVSVKEPNVVAYQIHYKEEAFEEELFIIHNANPYKIIVPLPEGTWQLCINGTRAGETCLSKVTKEITVEKISTVALVMKRDYLELAQSVAQSEIKDCVVKATDIRNMKTSEKKGKCSVGVLGCVMLALVAFKRKRRDGRRKY